MSTKRENSLEDSKTFVKKQRTQMANKTPVMILQEFMVKRKGTLEFNLTRQSGGTHDPVFEFAVRANPVTAIGIGRSKKEAKHDAAKNALKELAELGLYSPDNEYGYLHSSPRRDSPDSFDKFQVNFVGQLKEFCAEKRLPDPKFDIISDIGPPHARKFTMSCSVASVKCTATQNTKKLAKQSVSKKMLQCLIDTVDCGGIIVPYEELSTCDQEAMDKRDECKGQPTVNLSRRICDYPHSFHELDAELLSNAKAILESEEEESIEKKLENTLNALEITYSVEELPSAVSNKFGMSVKIQSDPYYEIPAFGLSKEEAEKLAVFDAIRFLKIMLK